MLFEDFLAGTPPDPDHPIRWLLLFLEAHFDCSAFRRLDVSGTDEQEERHRLTDLKTARDLETWTRLTVELSEPKARLKARAIVEVLVAEFPRDYPPHELFEYEDILLRAMRPAKQRGRPMNQRPQAVAALEVKLKEPTLSWREVAERCCGCSERSHRQCGPKLSKQVRLLVSLLRRHRTLISKTLTKYPELSIAEKSFEFFHGN